MKLTVESTMSEFAVNVADAPTNGGGQAATAGGLAGLGDLGALFGLLPAMTL